MKVFSAVLLALSALVYAAAANAYVLTEKQCYQGAQISALAADQRDQGVTRKSLTEQTEARKDTYADVALYEIVLGIIRVTYDMPELTPQQHGERFFNECVRTKGQMNKKV